jgi:hypothetical protein
VRIIIECPERILHLEAEYIYADCPFAQLQTSCSPAADHTFSTTIPWRAGWTLRYSSCSTRVVLNCPVSML